VTGGGLSRWPPGGESGGTSGNYAKLVELASDTVCYVGEAVPGSLDTDSTWRIKRITQVDTDQWGDDIVIEWADSNANFDKSWINRLTYTYG